MKIMKIHIKSSLLVVLLGTIFLNSCNIDDRFEKMNIDENNPTSVPPEALLSNVERHVFDDHGGFDGGFIGQFAQHFSGNHATGIEYDQYQLTNGSFEGFFTGSYINSLKDCERIITQSKPGYEKFKGVAKILTAYRLGFLTSLYGDIPYSEALNASILKPKYDKQIDIYTTIQSLLAEGITDIDNGVVDLKGDFIYDGDTDKWKAAAYLLSARYHNHLSKKDPAGSATNALAAINKAKALGMNSSDWDLLIKFEGTAAFQNPWDALYQNGMIIANKPFLDNLIASGDPRTEALFASEDRNGNDVYGVGKIQSGIPATLDHSIVGGVDSYYGQVGSSIPAASYAELLMIEAEAALRSGDKPRAALAHNNAIKAHIDQVTSLPAGLARKATYIANFASETVITISLAKIMTEKHKIMIAMCVESWMDFRRHGNQYPTWATIPLDDTETAPIGTQYIQRILYPQAELDSNGSNVPTATIFTKLPIFQ
jgi:hypothetical protein